MLPKKYWHSKEHRRKFFEDFARENEIKNPNDWNRVTNQHILNAGGSALLKMYKGSLQNALKDTLGEGDDVLNN